MGDCITRKMTKEDWKKYGKLKVTEETKEKILNTRRLGFDLRNDNFLGRNSNGR